MVLQISDLVGKDASAVPMPKLELKIDAKTGTISLTYGVEEPEPDIRELPYIPAIPASVIENAKAKVIEHEVMEQVLSEGVTEEDIDAAEASEELEHIHVPRGTI